MDDPYFSKSLIYIAEHNDQGALGLIVNRPIDLNLAALFEKSMCRSKSRRSANYPCFRRAGTDRPRVRPAPPGRQLAIDAGCHVRDRAHEFARHPTGAGPCEGTPTGIAVALGYSGWGGGQLEHELSHEPGTPFVRPCNSGKINGAAGPTAPSRRPAAPAPPPGPC